MKLAVILLGAALLSCGTSTEEVSLARVGERRLDLPLEHPPPAPDEFRRLTPLPLPAASNLFSELSSRPGDAAARLELSEVYSREGYSWAANFVRATTDPLQGRAVDYPTADTSIAWGEPPREEVVYRREVETVDRVCDLVLENRYQEAVDLVSESFSEGPYSLREVAAWSYAALWYIVADAGPIEEAVHEIAFRVFITSLEDAYEPDCLATRAAGFQLLTNFFSVLKDPVSAYTAAAIEHELESRTPPEQRSEAYWKELEHRVEALRKEMQASVFEGP